MVRRKTTDAPANAEGANGTQPRALDARERRFVDEYIIDLDAKRAALVAGYSATMAATKAYQWVSSGQRKPHVYAAVLAAMDKRSKRTEITADRVLRELELLGFCNMQDYMRATEQGDPYLDFSGLTRDQAAALAEVTVEDFRDGRGEESRDVRRVKFKLSDKRAALVDIGKHLGMFKERIEHSGPNGGPIETKDSAASAVISAKLDEIAARLKAKPK
jgi:phage terminase small subunit